MQESKFSIAELTAIAQEASEALAIQERRIKALQDLAREWNAFSEGPIPGHLSVSHSDFGKWAKRRGDLQEKTSQLLGE